MPNSTNPKACACFLTESFSFTYGFDSFESRVRGFRLRYRFMPRWFSFTVIWFELVTYDNVQWDQIVLTLGLQWSTTVKSWPPIYSCFSSLNSFWTFHKWVFDLLPISTKYTDIVFVVSTRVTNLAPTHFLYVQHQKADCFLLKQ